MISKAWRRIVFGMVTAVSLASLIAGCGPAPAAPPTPTPSSSAETKKAATPAAKKLDKVMFQKPSRSGSWFIYSLGKNKGLFTEEGIDVEFVLAKAPLAAPMLLAAEADYSSQFSTGFEGGLAGVPVKAVMTAFKMANWHLMGGHGVNTGQDLKGKVIGTTSIGSGAYYATKEAVRYLGLDPDKDVTFVAIPGDVELVAALRTGKVGAISVKIPINLAAEKEGFKELAFTADFLEYPTNGLSTTDRKIKENRDQVKRMIRTALKSLIYWRDHPNDAIDLMVKDFKLEREEAKASYDEYVRTLGFDGGTSEKGLQFAADLALRAGIIKTPVPPEKGIDYSILREAQKELGLAK
ncbi:MAG: ABC transporter substrate-binding protein [Chloroflexi bacterium]|nr:ABC transporter substrate-binding protein [Chloroflexota bacterium]